MRTAQTKDAIRPAAFTIIELLISIALVLVLMLGVNYVFSSVGQATGLTQAVSRVTRDAQAAQSVMYKDILTADMVNAPFVVIRSFPTPAFRNHQDYLAAVDQSNPLIYTDALGTPVPYTPEMVNNRVHRTDLLLFFSRDKFVRQTGGGTFHPASGSPTQIEPYLSDMSCQEAMIWYGHLKLPDDAGNFSGATNPGAGVTPNANPNNFFADQWYLGRVAILLQEPLDASGKIVTSKAERDASGNVIPGSDDETWHISIKDNGAILDPLRFDSTSNSLIPFNLEDSRYDLAGTSMATMGKKNYTGNWWDDKVMGGRRFHAQPFLLGNAGSRLTPQQVALQSPIFLANCTQFIVEFAGDYVTQAPTPSNKPDNEIDYFLDTSVTPNIKRVRWYGYPRDVNGNGIIKASDGDVVPVRDYTGTPASFEKTPSFTDPGDYHNWNTGSIPVYTCAWAPDDKNRPWMFRIIFAIDDPNGRFTDPLTFEYIFRVPSREE